MELVFALKLSLEYVNLSRQARVLATVISEEPVDSDLLPAMHQRAEHILSRLDRIQQLHRKAA